MVEEVGIGVWWWGGDRGVVEEMGIGVWCWVGIAV